MLPLTLGFFFIRVRFFGTKGRFEFFDLGFDVEIVGPRSRGNHNLGQRLTIPDKGEFGVGGGNHDKKRQHDGQAEACRFRKFVQWGSFHIKAGLRPGTR